MIAVAVAILKVVLRASRVTFTARPSWRKPGPLMAAREGELCLPWGVAAVVIAIARSGIGSIGIATVRECRALCERAPITPWQWRIAWTVRVSHGAGTGVSCVGVGVCLKWAGEDAA